MANDLQRLTELAQRAAAQAQRAAAQATAATQPPVPAPPSPQAPVVPVVLPVVQAPAAPSQPTPMNAPAPAPAPASPAAPLQHVEQVAAANAKDTWFGALAFMGVGAVFALGIVGVAAWKMHASKEGANAFQPRPDDAALELLEHVADTGGTVYLEDVAPEWRWLLDSPRSPMRKYFNFGFMDGRKVAALNLDGQALARQSGLKIYVHPIVEHELGIAHHGWVQDAGVRERHMFCTSNKLARDAGLFESSLYDEEPER